MLSPIDIANKEFHGSFRGYNQTEVDEFLEAIVRDYEQVLTERDEFREKLDGMNQRLEYYHTLEETLNQTLLVAQGTAEEVKNNARKEADLILKEARHQADKLVAEGEAGRERLENNYQELRKETQLFKAQLKSLLQTQLELLETGQWSAVAGN